jgi:glycerophosphoryl diester phosphodiesterase
VRLYAHRGACLRAPENTIDAFRKALEDGATALELDVHRTRDGHFVVSHDPDGVRTARRAHSIRHLLLHEVKQWRLDHPSGPNDDSSAVVDRTIAVPTLAEVLEEFPQVPMSIDLKPSAPGYAAALIELVAAHGAENQVTVASFHDRVVHRVRRLGYPGRTALTRREVILLRFSPVLLLCRLIRGQAAQMPLRAAMIRLDTDRLLDRCRTLGLRADYWVVNDPAAARDLLTRGATGVMTDDPARIAPVMRELNPRE